MCHSPVASTENDTKFKSYSLEKAVVKHHKEEPSAPEKKNPDCKGKPINGIDTFLLNLFKKMKFG